MNELHNRAGPELKVNCRCGHPRLRHVNGQARCAVMVTDESGRSRSCGCVKFEEPSSKGLFATAVNLDERMEVAEAEVKRLRRLIVLLGQDEGGAVEKLTKENEAMRDTINAIINSPMSSRTEVQSRLLNLMQRL